MGKTYRFNRSTSKSRKYFEDDPADEHRYNQCVNKRGSYESARVAQKYADEQEEITGNKLKIYKCDYCKKYHLAKADKE